MTQGRVSGYEPGKNGYIGEISGLVFDRNFGVKIAFERIKQAYMPVVSLLRLGESRGESLICLI
mgnify:CR=1